ncbi:MAG: ATP-binding protein [Candidatus Margulisbacteria bacterium]|nr:ATP-binding protein [Candidatus Margulisiibacteriota bacterium]
MDISVIISRALAELLTFSFFGAIYLGIVWFYRTYVSTQIDIPFIIISLLCGTLVGRLHHEVRLFLQTSSDKLFLRGRYDYYKELSDASNKVGQTLSLHDILKVLYDTFHDVVEISNPKVYLPDNFSNMENVSNNYVPYSKETFEPEAGGLAIPNESQLVKELIAKREPQFEAKEAKAALVIPCMLENRLIAMFVLGRKLSEDPYTDEDIRLLTVLANQVAVALDHTRSYEKIKADLESAEKELERSQRLASIGTLVAGVTHEIRNPMTVIRGRVETLFNAERDEAYKKDAQRAILENADRIERIIQSMLGLARDRANRKVVDVNLSEVLERTFEFFPFDGTKLHKEVGSVPAFKGDVDSLREVFVNLMQNAIEAMAHGGTLTVRTYTEEGHAVVEIADTGKGVPPEIREKIFDPFFSSRHEGVGLGLSIAYRIVREHGGDMKFSSEVGKGTTFKITF